VCSSTAGSTFEVESLEAAIEEMSKQEQQAAAEPTAGSMASSTDIEASTPASDLSLERGRQRLMALDESLSQAQRDAARARVAEITAQLVADAAAPVVPAAVVEAAIAPPNVMQANVISLAQHPHAATQAWLRSILMHTDGDQVAAALAEWESKKVMITDWRTNPRSPSHTSTCRAHIQPRVHKSARCLHTQVLADDFGTSITGETLGCLRNLKWFNSDVRALVHLRITARPQTLRIFFLSTICL